jgi:sugar lactone lactonase YvrE
VNGNEHYYEGSFCGDGGPALNACLNTPFGVAMNPDGELLIADQANNRIRKIDRNGIINTIANVRTSYMAVDAAGNIWTSMPNALLRISPAGVVQRVAGASTEGFSGDGGPAALALVNTVCCGGVSGVAIDAEGNLFFTDGTNRRLRAIRYGAPEAARPADWASADSCLAWTRTRR